MTASPVGLVARLHGVGDVRVAPELDPDPRTGEVLVRVLAVGLCGSDLHWYREGSIGDARLDHPLVPGHEFSGVIVDGPRAGERVVAEPADPCGRCESCLAGHANVCIAGRFAGFAETDGALRSVMAWPARLLHRIPDALDHDAATLLEPLGVALHAVDLAPITPGSRVGVYGCGPLGLLVVQLARLAGAAVIVATDRLPHRVDAACAMGATDGIVVADGSPAGAAGASDAARRRTVDVAFEASGDDAALDDAIAAIRPGGTVVLVGIPEADRTSFGAAAARRKELTLQLCRRMQPDDLPRAIALAESGAVELGGLVSHRVPIGDASGAFEIAASRSGLKVVVEPWPAVDDSGRP